MVAELEADKAAFDFKSPAIGTVTELLCEEGDTVKRTRTIARVAGVASFRCPRLLFRVTPAPAAR